MKYLKLKKPGAQIALVYRKNTPDAKKWAHKIIQWGRKNHVRVGIAPEQNPLSGAMLLSEKDFLKSQLIVSLGGDGTYLRANRLLKGTSIPILGVHLGTLGFLTPTVAKDTLKMIDKAFSGKLALIPRSMIQIDYRRKGRILFKSLSLNDVVVERGQKSQLIHLSLHCGQDWVTHAKADGIVVSSPMGSTAYNLAVGGPILHPDAKVFSVSLIAPHSLTARPLVLPDSFPIRLAIVKNGTYDICGRLVVDGRIITNVEAEDEVLLSRAKTTHWLVRDPEVHDFQILREKLNFGERL
jgi:NAD+ kinase